VLCEHRTPGRAVPSCSQSTLQARSPRRSPARTEGLLRPGPARGRDSHNSNNRSRRSSREFVPRGRFERPPTSSTSSAGILPRPCSITRTLPAVTCLPCEAEGDRRSRPRPCRGSRRAVAAPHVARLRLRKRCQVWWISSFSQLPSNNSSDCAAGRIGMVVPQRGWTPP